MPTALQLGQAANLLFGYQPAWNPSGSVNYPFFAPSVASTTLIPPVFAPPVAPATTGWSSTPLITLHASPSDLLSAIYKYNVASMTLDPAGASVPVGPLALGDADSANALQAAGAFLGLDLTAAQSYMLVTFERIEGSAQHPFISNPSSVDRSSYLTAAALSTISGLTPAQAPETGSVLYDSKLTAAEAGAYITAIYQLGTHFVTEITTGDRLIQVFGYDADHFKILVNNFASDATTQPDGSLAVSGSLTAAWAYYTTQVSGVYGFVANYGHLATISQDPTLPAAITAGKWANAHVPTGTPSIFAALNNNLLTPLVQSVPTVLTLTPIADLISNTLVAGPWDRLVVGGLLQKYGSELEVPLRREADYDWGSLFPQTDDSWTSNIVTPTIDIYQERIDLAKVTLQGGTLVSANYEMKSFTAFAQVMEATTQPGADPIPLPSDNIILIAQIIDTTEAAQTPVLSMNPNAFQNFSVVCEEMYGALIFEDNSSNGARRKVALDGFLFETNATVDPTTQRYVIGLAGVLSDAPSADLVAQLKQSIEYSVVAGDSLLQATGPNAETVREIEQSYLLWLAGIIPANTSDPDLAYNRARALYLARNVGTFSSTAVSVPYVTYETYSKYVGDLVTQAQTINGQILNFQGQITSTINSYKVMDSIANLNDNIKQIGGVLTQYFTALADGNKAMGGYYDSILDQLNQESQQNLQDINDLTAKLAAQQTVINSTSETPGIIQQFQQDYADYEKDEIAQAVVEGVTGLFSLGMAVFALPEAPEGILAALEAIQKVYEKIQAVMKVLAALQDVIKTVGTATAELNTLSSEIGALSDNLQMPSQVDLQTVSQNVNAALANVPTTPGSLNQDKANLVAAVNTLVIIGTALLQAQTRASQLAMQVINTNRLKAINGQQQSQMSALTTSLHLNGSTEPPDINSIDLIGVTGQLQYQLKQVLLTLAQTLELQNGAIQFEYFGQPSEITSFSLTNLLGVIATQDSNIINGITSLNPQPQAVTQPITITIPNVVATKVSGTNVFQFPIHLCDTAFYNYDMVRINRVVPNITGIASTTSGNYEIHLTCQAQPFQDRDYQRNPRTFSSVARQFGPYVYNASTGAAEFGDNTGTFADDVTQLTPFSLWQISLPGDVENNQGITFETLFVDIQLDFYITAHYDDPATRHTAMVQRMRAMGRHVSPMLESMAATPDAPSLTLLEAQMNQNQAVLQGWDAVFNVLDGPVNAFLNEQFQAYVKQLNPQTSTNLMTINASYCEGVQKISVGGQTIWFTNVTQMAIELSNPLLQFVAGNDSVTVQQNILAATITTGTLQVTQTGFDPNNCALPGGPVTCVADPATGILTLTPAGYLEDNMVVMLSSTGTLPAPLQANTDYWIVNWTNSGGKTTLQLAATAGGTPIALTSAGTGVCTIAPDISWSTPVVADISQNPYVQGSVALAKLNGVVTPPPGQGTAADTLTVILDFPSGAFTLNQFAVEPPNWDPTHHAIQISNALANFYASNDIKYQVHTINTKNLSLDANLTPGKFLLNATTTNAGNNILQILISTGTDPVQSAHTILLNEPIPYNPVNPVPNDSNYMVSLMIGTELMFNHIFVDSFNKGGTNIQVAPVNPGVQFKAWSASIIAGSATAPANFANPYTVDNTQVNYRISENSDNIVWSLVGLIFGASPSAGVQLSYTNMPNGTPVSFQYQQWFSNPYGGGSWGSWQDASAIADITMSGNYPLQVTGAGAAQLVSFSTVVPTVTFDKSSDLTPETGCQCNDNDIKIALLNALGTSVPATLKAYIEQITFTPISVFALESLLFPADQLITMQEARVPGDLLVVGTFLAQVRKTNPTYDVTISAAAGAQGVFGTTTFKNGTPVNSATQSGLTNQIAFTYGPLNSALGGLVNYTLDLNTGTISPPLLVLVVQPDPVNSPQTVIVIPPGYGPTAG
jgi:hypothetical protein